MNMLTHALAYASKGYSVLPIKANDKTPLIAYSNRPPLTKEEIEEYWTRYPDANTALKTTDFFVMDIDTKEAHGVDGLKSYKNLPKGAVIPTQTQRTASGGLQLFYKKPNNADIKQIIGFKSGIDIKAHENNYVLVPPSQTDKGKYEWITGLKMVEPTPLLINLICNHHPQPSGYNGNSYRTLGRKKWTGSLLDRLVEGAPEGQRNDFLTRLCGQLIYTKADDKTVWELLNFANNHNQPPLEQQEVRKIMTSILKRELSKHE
ncbi:bifunctional DNA primase/polymerase [Limosilactobacillus sp. RRLNB_1_1]|uniref:Bifunctional DNA primase/polymerase n=1 Tax=Limosilactobacillus albertensis TaxID=2759752 RepID=A0A7W3TPY9_9LACO|nr:bifunctional DNA primase/polymerase [Limosilactobacillus albertensis]MBB1068752.1 bifunctional DNA primase/polymerase [Limosilactobacillus albertensis]MCD7118303.1 bifunctional DNA primase/polymerase [Limosilactobacillus albertensis]MCD7127511.1 bifunctional DNA primase/polymerase [Limosilactobacillus albertensis]